MTDPITDPDSHIVERFLSGDSQSQIARDTGRSREYVRGVIAGYASANQADATTMLWQHGETIQRLIKHCLLNIARAEELGHFAAGATDALIKVLDRQAKTFGLGGSELVQPLHRAPLGPADLEALARLRNAT